MNRLPYFASCGSWLSFLPVEDLDLMTRSSQEISRKTFLKYVDPESMNMLQEDLGYDRRFPMAKDPYIAYYKSKVRGCPVVFFVWSASEYVFADRECVMRPV